jgi:putative redox protein
MQDKPQAATSPYVCVFAGHAKWKARMATEQATNVWKEITATWDGALGYRAENKAGATLLMGLDQDGNAHIGPMEMLLVGLAGCTAMDILDILRKKRQVPDDFKITVRGNQRTDVYPKVYTEFQVEYVLWGDGLQVKDVEQAIRLSEEKYCSVGATLAKAGPIRSTYRILKPGEKIEIMVD